MWLGTSSTKTQSSKIYGKEKDQNRCVAAGDRKQKRERRRGGEEERRKDARFTGNLDLSSSQICASATNLKLGRQQQDRLNLLVLRLFFLFSALVGVL